MPKTRLGVNRRREIVQYMLQEWDKKQPELDDTARKEFVTLLNGEIRKTYPEKEMAILRKYKLTENCRFKRFTTHVYTTTFYEFLEEEELADYPRSQPPMKISESTMDAYNKLVKTKNKLEEKREKQRQKYRDFVNSFNYLEDIEQIVPLPETIKPPVRSLVCINPEIIAEIKKDFGNE